MKKPMLADFADLTKLNYPVLVSPKLDGVRCTIQGGVALSRTLKPIPQPAVQAMVKFLQLPDGLDGELLLDTGDFNDCQSFFMSKQEQQADWKFHVFDTFAVSGGYTRRYSALEEIVDTLSTRRIRQVAQCECQNRAHVEQQLRSNLLLGYEGLMIRDPDAPYKHGRATVGGGELLKLKPVCDEEAVVIDTVRKMRNDNPATKNELGRTKRSSAKAGKVALDELGALVCITVRGQAQFEIGTGFTAKQRKDFWSRREELLGKVVTFTYQPPAGRQRADDEVPRGPAVFKGFRSVEDTS